MLIAIESMSVLIKKRWIRFLAFSKSVPIFVSAQTQPHSDTLIFPRRFLSWMSQNGSSHPERSMLQTRWLDKAPDLEADLRHFTGSEFYYQNPLGVKYLADKAGSHCSSTWLPATSQAQGPPLPATVNQEGQGRLGRVSAGGQGSADSVKQKIGWTDFPLENWNSTGLWRAVAASEYWAESAFIPEKETRICWRRRAHSIYEWKSFDLSRLLECSFCQIRTSLCNVKLHLSQTTVVWYC